ncbi:MAG: FliM/FliN family flagellar motor switch protein [Acidobacteriaceae bacterium]
MAAKKDPSKGKKTTAKNLSSNKEEKAKALAKLCMECLRLQMEQLSGTEFHLHEAIKERTSAATDSVEWLQYEVAGDAQGWFAIGAATEVLSRLVRLTRFAAAESENAETANEKTRKVWARVLSSVTEQLPGALQKQLGWNCRFVGPIQNSSVRVDAVTSLKERHTFSLESDGGMFALDLIVDMDRVMQRPAVMTEEKQEDALREMLPETANQMAGDMEQPRADILHSQGGKSREEDADRKSQEVSFAAYDLLMDVELEATLRFGARELALEEVLALGPGDVVEMDRHMAEPVDLVVGDKIVARGEVVLVNGSFGLRVTEVAAPQLRLESIRCLF